MNENIAVDPDIRFNSRDLKILLSKFGFDKSRYISRMPENWSEEIRSSLKDLASIERTRCVELLFKHRDSMRLTFPSEEFQAPWLDKAKTALKKNFVQAILTENEADDCITFEEFIFNDNKYPVNIHSYVVPASTASYLEAFQPLIEMSEELFLADRYFHLSKYRDSDNSPYADRLKQEFLHQLFTRIDSQRSHKKLIIFFERLNSVDKDEQEQDITEDIKSITKKIGLKYLKISFKIIKKMEHPRYFFSIKGAVILDKGIFIKDAEETQLTFTGAENAQSTVFNLYEKYI